MHRPEAYILAFVTTFLSLYGKDVIRVARRGWTRGRINSLKTELGEVTAMHGDLSFLVAFVGLMVFRTLFLLSLMIVVIANGVFASNGIFGLTHSDRALIVVSGLFGLVIADLAKGMRRLIRTIAFDSYEAKTIHKVARLTGRL